MRCVAYICGLIHQVYGDFSEPLKKGLVKMFDGYGGKEEDKVRVVLCEKVAEHRFCTLAGLSAENKHMLVGLRKTACC